MEKISCVLTGLMLLLCGILLLAALLLLPLSLIGITLAQMLVEVAGRYHYSLVPILVLLAAVSLGEREQAAEAHPV